MLKFSYSNRVVQELQRIFIAQTIGNPNAKWEKAVTTNVGFDGSFLGGKLDVVFDVWKKEHRISYFKFL